MNLRTPYRFDNRDPLLVYAVYATEVDSPENETPVEWMLLTTEIVVDIQIASTSPHNYYLSYQSQYY